MKRFIKAYWKTLLFFAIIGLFGGFFTGIYMLDSYPADIKQQLLEELNANGLGQIPADILLGVVTAMQAAAYGIVLGAAGIWLGRKTGLWRDERGITKKPLAAALIAAVAGGKGGGRPDFAMAGGKDITKAEDAINGVEAIVTSMAK